jgi:hypothetical protein
VPPYAPDWHEGRNHSFRATGITAYLKNGRAPEKAPQIANHASTRTTQLYDRGSRLRRLGRRGSREWKAYGSRSTQPSIAHKKRATRSSLFGHSLQLRVLCRKDWLFVRKEALVSLADGAASARDPTAPSARADPGLVLVRGPDRPDLQDERRVGS